MHQQVWTVMRSLKYLLLPLVLGTMLLSQCSRPDSEKKGTQESPAAGSTPASPLPSGINPAGGQGNSPTLNPNNPQTNPQTNLDGSQSPNPDKRKP